MIRHLVFFTARHAADLATMRATLATLATIPGVRGFEVGVNERHDQISAHERSGGEVDLVVHAVFDDHAALAAYTAHPIYQRSVEVVRPLRETRIAVDYEVEAPSPPRSAGSPGT